MFAFFGGTSRKIARNLIQVTGLGESLSVFQKNNFSNIGEVEVLKLLLAMDACNLLQTMKEEIIAREIPEEDLQDTVEDYVVENLKILTVIPCRDGAERMEQCQDILKVAAKFQDYWNKEEAKDPGPRFYCVKELLRRLGCEANTPIHDNLFEFVYEQHNRFIRYFRTLLEPFREDEAPAPAIDPPRLSVAIHSPVPETVPGSPLAPAMEPPPLSEDFPDLTPKTVSAPPPETSHVEPEKPEGSEGEGRPIADLFLGGLEDLSEAGNGKGGSPPPDQNAAAVEVGLKKTNPSRWEDFTPMENLSPISALSGEKELPEGASATPEGEPRPERPNSKMLEELFRKVNPLDDDFFEKK